MSSPARTPAAAKAQRKNLGRQKIKMEKIKNPDHLNVTFSKRRSGLFKKAHELSVMTGAEVALVCFSPAGKAFSYGSPDLAHVANRFENGGGPAPPSTMATQMNNQVMQMEKKLEDEKKKMEDLDKKDTEFNRRCWWREENLPPHIGLEEVERMRDAMEDLKLYLAEQEKLVAEQERLVAEQEAAAAASNPPMELYGKYLNMGGADPFAAGPSSAMALLAEQAAAAAASNPPVDLYGNYLTMGGADPFACGPSSMMALLTEQGAAASHFPMDQYGNYVPSGGADPFAAGPSSSAAAGASSSNSQFQHGGGSDYGFGQLGPN